MRKRITAFALCCCLIIGTGCGSVVPKLSEEESGVSSEEEDSKTSSEDEDAFSELNPHLLTML